MKRFSIIALVFVLSLSLAACGRRKNNEMTVPTTTEATSNTIMPDIMPTIETNIPDPSVDTSMPEYNFGTDATDHTGIYDSTEDSKPSTRKVH